MFYLLLYPVLYSLLLPLLFYRLGLQGWRQRLMLDSSTQAGGPCLWLHCASVGEVMAARPLIEALLARQQPLVVTTFTCTGSERLTALFGDNVGHQLMPLDLAWCWRRFFRRWQPSALLLIETELWPQMLACCQRYHCPVTVINARLSPRSMRRLPLLRPLLAPLLGAIDKVLAQSQQDSARFCRLGLMPDRIVTVGNIKFDVQLNDRDRLHCAQLASQLPERPRLLAASTHDGEEQLALQAFSHLRRQCPEAQLVLVPRHPQRFAGVAGLLSDQSWHYCRRSQADTAALAAADVILVDTMGELLSWYGQARAAFIGGSVAPVGGHNPIEAVLMDCAIVSGPVVHNFRDIYRLLDEAGAMDWASDAGQLARVWQQLLTDSRLHQQRLAAARRLLAQQQGALQRTLNAIAPQLVPDKASSNPDPA